MVAPGLGGKFALFPADNINCKITLAMANNNTTYTGRYCPVYLILLFPMLAIATGNNIGYRYTSGSIQLTQTEHSGVEFQLQTRDASVSRVIDEISHQTGVPIHYSILPKTPVSATCTGSNVEQLLTCLLGPNANLAVHHQPGTQQNQTRKNTRTAEIWILSSTLNQNQENGICVPEIQNKSVQKKIPKENANNALEQIITRTKTTNSDFRAQAITEISHLKIADNNKIYEILQTALTDDAPEVRAQAIAGLVRRKGDEAKAELQQTLLFDTDAQVRLMALSLVTDDFHLLEQALTDNNSDVRLFAKMKLEEYTRTNSNLLPD